MTTLQDMGNQVADLAGLSCTLDSTEGCQVPAQSIQLYFQSATIITNVNYNTQLTTSVK